MSFIQTMKGQAVEAGANIVNWPKDGIISWYLPLNDGDGTVAKDNISEVDLEGAAAINTTSGATCAFVVAGLTINDELSNVQMPENNSFVFFIKTNVPASDQILQIGDAVSDRISLSSIAGVKNYYEDSDATFNDSVFTAGVDQMCMCVVDRENGTVSFYGGVDGTSLISVGEVSKTGTFSPSTIRFISAQSTVPLTYGLGMLIFPDGIPVNFAAMMTHISDELTADRKLNWMYNIVDDFIL